MRVLLAQLFAVLLLFTSSAFAQGLAIPRRHDRAPGPALTPEQAVAKMTVPEGFTVEIVASEPQIMNPVAMCIDEKGRFWVTESFEYPRREAGPGRDRIKVLEDTDQDGKVDKVTIFAEGLNIPSGINVGHGGVWVCNAPDLLFLEDTDGDLKADKTSVLLTGWGRDDTHELPNSLTWGPDGWLYGLNGVFNFSHVKYGKDNPNLTKNPDHPGWPLTCAVWRINPHTKEFDIFAEGTSNPWGIAINDEGEFFLSACVIDHLWHITQSGYYIRQGGPYPPHTWPIGSIVEHKHQKAAYCGITWFDSDAYPEEYRKVFYMGNIHGGCINADITEPHGSTYKGKPHPGFTPKPGAFEGDEFHTARKTGDEKNPKLADLLTANDPWFMPVVQKTGPDGCLYILDWYDRYHCYQDANADPAGIEREKGRLYRLVHNATGRLPVRDLSTAKPRELIDIALNGRDNYQRETAQRLLAERDWKNNQANELGKELEAVIKNPATPVVQARRALWIHGTTSLARTHQPPDQVRSELRPWAIRQAQAQIPRYRQFIEFLGVLPSDPSTLSAMERATWVTQISIGHRRFRSDPEEPWFKNPDHLADHIEPLLRIAASDTNDTLLQQLVWQNLNADIRENPSILVKGLENTIRIRPLTGLGHILPRAIDAALDTAQGDRESSTKLVAFLMSQPGVEPATRDHLTAAVSRISLKNGTEGDAFKVEFEKYVNDKMDAPSPPVEVATLSALWGQERGLQRLTELAQSPAVENDSMRLRAFSALISMKATDRTHLVMDSWFNLDVTENSSDKNLHRKNQVLRDLILAWGAEPSPMIGSMLISHFSKVESNTANAIIEVCTQRAEWSTPLLAAIEAKTISKDALNLNQLRRMASFKDEAFAKQFKTLYGTIREGRNPDREHVINNTRDFLHGTPGDAERGIAVYKKVCAQCHKLYGEGAEVGPDLTGSGRNNWDQLLTNVLDPSLVIGGSYQARILQTTDGRVLTGLAVEDNDQRVVLKVQGGKLETIPRDQIEVYKVSEVSMMPEQLEKQITPQELADLFSYLALDKPPSDPSAKYLPGYPRLK